MLQMWKMATLVFSKIMIDVRAGFKHCNIPVIDHVEQIIDEICLQYKYTIPFWS